MIYARPSFSTDAEELAPRMREEDAEEVLAASGSSPLKALQDGYELSEQAFSIFHKTDTEDTLVSMFGLLPSLGTPEAGVVWMLCAQGIERVAADVLRQSAYFIEHFHRRYPLLYNFVDKRNRMHLKWCLKAGFIALKEHEVHGLAGLPFVEIVKVKTPHV